jgi:hypothetical protein
LWDTASPSGGVRFTETVDLQATALIMTLL